MIRKKKQYKKIDYSQIVYIHIHTFFNNLTIIIV